MLLRETLYISPTLPQPPPPECFSLLHAFNSLQPLLCLSTLLPSAPRKDSTAVGTAQAANSAGGDHLG